MVLLRLLPAVLLAAALLGACGGGDDDPASTTPKSTKTAPAADKPAVTTDRGARRCTKAAILAALLVDVEPLPYKVNEVRCKGEFARSRFVLANCPAGQASVACGSAKVAAWRRGAKRWRLITVLDGLSCAEVRKKAGDFPSSLCS